MPKIPPSVFWAFFPFYTTLKCLQSHNFKPKEMSNQKFQSCGTACCDCTAICKHDIVEEFGEQNAALFARWVWLKNDYAALCFLIVESTVEASELVFMVKFTRFWLMRVKHSLKNALNYKLKPSRKSLLNT
jgi:hypothetical protein